MKVAYSRLQDRDLWNDFLEGDCDAFDRIYNNYMPLLYNYSKKYIVNEQLSEDIIQDFFVDLWNKKDRLGRTDNIKLYLLKSIRRRILRALENENKKQQVNKDYIQDFNMTVESVLQTDDSKRVEQSLNAAINELSNVQKQIIFLKFYNNCSLSEISSILDISRKSVYNGLFNAMKSLRNKINL